MTLASTVLCLNFNDKLNFLSVHWEFVSLINKFGLASSGVQFFFFFYK